MVVHRRNKADRNVTQRKARRCQNLDSYVTVDTVENGALKVGTSRNFANNLQDSFDRRV